MRCFVALPVPAAVAETLLHLAEARRAAFPHARWSHAGDLHVTLQFLGEVRTEQLPEVTSALRAALARTRSLELQLPEFGVFSGAGVLLAAVTLSEELQALMRRVAEALRGCGFEPELRPFRPHVTLARTRRSLPAEQLFRWIGPIEPAVRVPCVDVVLYHSRGAPTSEEKRYEAVSEIPLRLPTETIEEEEWSTEWESNP